MSIVTMHLSNLVDREWNSYEKDRFLKDSTKTKTDGFDPEAFKHDGFEDREKYLETYVPALADEGRVRAELTNFTPPRLGAINGSPYQALVIRYGILRTLVREPQYAMPKDELLETVQEWQRDIIEADREFPDDDTLFHLSKAAVDHGSDVDDSELHLIYRYMELHNEQQRWKHNHQTWRDVFERLSTIDRFPKVSRSEKPEHALDTIEKGLWSLQEQALVYEVIDDGRNLVGIPEDYDDVVREWVSYEMSTQNLHTMLETLDQFDRQSTLIDARETFGIDTKTGGGRNDKRRESLVNAGVYPSDLLDEALTKDNLKDIVEEYGIDAHKRRRNEMTQGIIDYFERAQKSVEEGEPKWELFLESYEAIADGNIEQVPPQLQTLVEESDRGKKLEILFEEATAEIFEEVFNLDGTELLGQTSGGNVADGQIEQDGKWLLWDNKRRSGKFKLDADTRAKIKDYIDTKDQQHNVEWFLIIAPEFASSAKQRANQLEMQVGGIDIRLVEASAFVELARHWQTEYDDGAEFPLSVLHGSDTLDLETAEGALKTMFS
jgi:hypothetical protein